ncbi:MAG: hypothetical protein JWO40_671 [Candidatus Doudnabacteria bacterium]|nr:hypothetical protein [Candidatus Doudnabacteria bacterium]
MKINPYFRTTLAKPFQGKFLHEAGAEVILNIPINSKTIGNFIIMLPDPVSLNLNNAQAFIDKWVKLKERINKSKNFTVYSSALSEDDISGKSQEQIKHLDPNANFYRTLDEEKVFECIQSSIGVVISLITAMEAFVNVVIPHDYILQRTNKRSEKENLNKDSIVKKLSISEKIILIADIKGKADLKEQVFWSTFHEVKKLRNDIIHFKKTDANINNMWAPIIIGFLDSDLQKFFDHFVIMIDYLHSGYLDTKTNI